MSGQSVILHASCVAMAGNAVLITGPSGSGKSALALQLLALGADLIADDRTELTLHSGRVVASSPPAIKGRIEARGVGIIALDHLADAAVALVVDMAQTEVARLPQQHSVTILDIRLPCLHKVDAPYFPAAIHACLRGCRDEIE